MKKHNCGDIRVAAYNHVWHGFNLQVGHLYGETVDGLRYVSACRMSKHGKILVYCQMKEEEARWEIDEFPKDSVLGVQLLAACRARNDGGVTRVNIRPAGRAGIAAIMGHNGRY